MKEIIKSFLFTLVWLVSRVYTYKASQVITRFKNKLYTLWIRNFIGNLGTHSSIHYPCFLQGGGSKRISIGDCTCIQSHSILGCWERYNAYDGQQSFTPEIIIGNHCSIGEYTQITAINKITIGDGLLTGRYVYIGDNAHGGLSHVEANVLPSRRKLTSKGEILIGNNVWIGDKVTILGGVTIGDNVIIGANSVVTHDVSSNSIWAGISSREVKKLTCISIEDNY